MLPSKRLRQSQCNIETKNELNLMHDDMHVPHHRVILSYFGLATILWLSNILIFNIFV